MCTVLQFSGGKDSLACLYMLESRWSEIIVAWVNTGAAFPETIALMDSVRRIVPDFREIRSRQSISEQGHPVDLVPAQAGLIGVLTEGYSGPRFQSRYACCSAALWAPMQKALKEWKATVVIRGQKRADRRRVPVKHGAVIDGIEYRFPLEDWDDDQVLDYLKERGVEMPVNYKQMSTGLDCWNCTAYLSENKGKAAYLRQHHPAWYAQVRSVLDAYGRALDNSLTDLRNFNEC